MISFPPVDCHELFTGGLSNPSRNVLDFNDWRNLQSLFDAAKAAGIFIVLRPGRCDILFPFAFYSINLNRTLCMICLNN